MTAPLTASDLKNLYMGFFLRNMKISGYHRKSMKNKEDAINVINDAALGMLNRDDCHDGLHCNKLLQTFIFRIYIIYANMFSQVFIFTIDKRFLKFVFKILKRLPNY